MSDGLDLQASLAAANDRLAQQEAVIEAERDEILRLKLLIQRHEAMIRKQTDRVREELTRNAVLTNALMFYADQPGVSSGIAKGVLASAPARASAMVDVVTEALAYRDRPDRGNKKLFEAASRYRALQSGGGMT